MEGDTVAFYLHHLATREGVLVLAALAGLATVRRWRIAAVLLAFPVLYGVVVGLQTVRNDRTIMLILPPLAILAAFLAERLRPAAGVVLAVAVGFAVTTVPPAGPTTWARAREWLDDRPGTTVLAEAYSPFLAHHHVVGRVRLIDGAVPPGTDYLVAAEDMYGRYTADRYPREHQAYEDLFARYREVGRFDGNGPTIRVLSTR
jgi:hypothetical protein